MRSTRRAFTLIELLVVIAIIAILAAILFPVFAKAREKARQSSCASNVKQQTTAVMQYTQDYDESMPRTYFSPASPPGNQSWAMVIAPYCKSAQVFNCPSNTFKWDGTWSESMSYGYTILAEGASLALAQIGKTSETILLGDGTNFRLKPFGHTACERAASTARLCEPRHNELVNVGFVDGHVKPWKKETIEKSAASEDGTALTGNNTFVYFNVY